MNIPIEYQIWSAQQCADYLGQSYSTFIKHTQFTPEFPKRLAFSKRPKWNAFEVMTWGNHKKAA